jgi:hypothetical protein
LKKVARYIRKKIELANIFWICPTTHLRVMVAAIFAAIFFLCLLLHVLAMGAVQNYKAKTPVVTHIKCKMVGKEKKNQTPDVVSQSLSLISFGYARRHIYESWLQPFLQPFFFYVYFCMSKDWERRWKIIVVTMGAVQNYKAKTPVVTHIKCKIYESWLQPFLQPFFFYVYFCMSWQDRQFDLFPYIIRDKDWERRWKIIVVTMGAVQNYKAKTPVVTHIDHRSYNFSPLESRHLRDNFHFLTL